MAPKLKAGPRALGANSERWMSQSRFASFPRNQLGSCVSLTQLPVRAIDGSSSALDTFCLRQLPFARNQINLARELGESVGQWGVLIDDENVWDFNAMLRDSRAPSLDSRKNLVLFPRYVYAAYAAVSSNLPRSACECDWLQGFSRVIFWDSFPTGWMAQALFITCRRLFGITDCVYDPCSASISMLAICCLARHSVYFISLLSISLSS